MAFKSDQDGEITDINITPFVDVVLVLLVIFMVTAPVMLQESLKVNLPKTLSADLTTKAATKAVAITKEGQVLIDGIIMGQEGLLRELRKISSENPETNFLISADADSRHGDVVSFIDLLKRNNLNRFAIQVERIQEK